MKITGMENASQYEVTMTGAKQSYIANLNQSSLDQYNCILGNVNINLFRSNDIQLMVALIPT